jgi:hypothetical protein
MSKNCFTDTCVFFAFASPFPFEPFNQACTDFFQKDYNYYTGKRVIKELDNRWRRRQKVYEDLSKLNGSLSANQVLSMKLNANDERHFCGVIGFLKSTYPKDMVLSQLRDMQRVIGKGLDEGKKKITLPYIEEFDDDICFAFLAYTENVNDAQILTDALCWSEKRWEEKKLLTFFSTLDYNDIITKRPDIIKVICNTRDCQETEIPLQICSVLAMN